MATIVVVDFMIIFYLVWVERKERLMRVAVSDVNIILIEGCTHLVAGMHRRSTSRIRLQSAISVVLLKEMSRLGSN